MGYLKSVSDQIGSSAHYEESIAKAVMLSLLNAVSLKGFIP